MIIVNQAGLMHDSELDQMDIDPDWQPMQIVSIREREYAVIGKSKDRRIQEYLVCPLNLLGLLVSREGIAKFKEVNPGRG